MGHLHVKADTQARVEAEQTQQRSLETFRNLYDGEA